ncbi:MAG: membrane protein insertase YidC [Lachnospiraceae bacterium]|nr:membrane protein insertase YidC [Lachnospiraceae bacterium]
MDGIFVLLDKMGIPNIGLSIILFTIVIYGCMTPLTIKQQKFSKLSAKMNPELQEIQKKYKNKKDNESMMAMNEETRAVYDKYGVSPTGSCLQLLIQMPILFALYRVINAMPAYVKQIKEAYFPLVDKLIGQVGSSELLQSFTNSRMYEKQFQNEAFLNGTASYVQNTYIDCLNRASTAEWQSIMDKFPSLSADVTDTVGKLNEYNNFLGLNIANSPSFMLKEAFTAGAYLMVVVALMIPFLAAFTQWLNVKLMPQPDTKGKDGQENSMAASMKMMNTMMPIMSAVFCFTLPAGMGIYWVAGAVVRSVQQVLINKHIDKIDMDDVIQKNLEKREKKLEKMGISGKQINDNASINTKRMNSSNSLYSETEKEEKLRRAREYFETHREPGSIAAKANMVREYNEKNNKK